MINRRGRNAWKRWAKKCLDDENNLPSSNPGYQQLITCALLKARVQISLAVRGALWSIRIYSTAWGGNQAKNVSAVDESPPPVLRYPPLSGHPSFCIIL
jgi:hypothetical protein